MFRLTRGVGRHRVMRAQYRLVQGHCACELKECALHDAAGDTAGSVATHSVCDEPNPVVRVGPYRILILAVSVARVRTCGKMKHQNRPTISLATFLNCAGSKFALVFRAV